MADSILEHFGELPDPRRQAGRRHYLSDLLTIAICAVICGADDFESMAEFGQSKWEWFKAYLKLPHGIPSHDTFRRVIAALDPEAFERCFVSWMNALAGGSRAQVIPIDGKTLRRSFNRASNKAAVHMVSAWAAENELVFGQLATDAKSNEITAIPRLLELLDLRGATVTIDAEGCQKNIARKIVDQGGDYVLALKGNQPTMFEEVQLFLDDAINRGDKGTALEFHQSVEGDHGRIETRRLWWTPEVDWFQDRSQWAGLGSFAVVERERTAGGETTCERHYFISSHDQCGAEFMAHAIRSHWRVENSLHWCLDVSFGEDQCRVRIGHAPENLSRLRRIALSLLKQETKVCKLGIKNKRLRAGWDNDYLLRVLQI
ncbi:MAG TPA: ISAs1 family transposase [Ramlibacter sp.]|jgi:predicted transposase YbfD/YdcC